MKKVAFILNPISGTRTKKTILKYIEKYGLSQEAYEYLLKGAYEWDAEFRKFITVYAQKKGLTQKQYMQLMQSVRCSEAPMLRQYVK